MKKSIKEINLKSKEKINKTEKNIIINNKMKLIMNIINNSIFPRLYNKYNIKRYFRIIFIILTYPIQYYTQCTPVKILLLVINIIVIILIKNIFQLINIFLIKYNLLIERNKGFFIGSIIIILSLLLINKETPEFYYNKSSKFSKEFILKVKDITIYNYNHIILTIWLIFNRLFYGNLEKMKDFKGLKIEEFDNRDFKLKNKGRNFLNKLYYKLIGEDLFKEYNKNIKDYSKKDIIILIIHGINSSSNSKTIRSLIYNIPLISISINLRGQRNSIPLPINDYSIPHLGFYNDVIIGIEYINKQFPNLDIIILGCSLGGNLTINAISNLINKSTSLINYKSNKIIGSIILSPALDFEFYETKLDSTIKNLFINSYIKKLKEFYKKNTFLLLNKKEKEFNIKNNLFSYNNISEYAINKLERINNCISLQELDSVLLNDYNENYSSIYEYYRDSSCIHKFKEISIPILIVHSENDNILPSIIPFDDIIKPNSNLIYCKLKYGAHLLYYTPTGEFSLGNLIYQFIKSLSI